jgi:hypothetical protein
MPVVRKREHDTYSRDAQASIVPMDQAHSSMECRVMHSTASEHRLERVMEAKNAERYTTLHTFYQMKEAPTAETGVSYRHSNLRPPCRRED